MIIIIIIIIIIIMNKNENEWDTMKLTSYTICTNIFKFFVNIGLIMAYSGRNY